MAQAVRDHPADPVGAILKLKICDPACGSGHFLLAAARRMGAEIARLEGGSDTPGEQQRQHALREVVRHCIYGVDKNPLSVELCKIALWIEALEPGKPLTFLDHRIKCGDSLVGATPLAIQSGIPDAAFEPVTGDDKKACSALKKRNKEQQKWRLNSLFRDDDLLGSASHEPQPWESLGDLFTAMLNMNAMPADTLNDVDEQKRRYSAHVQSGGYLNGRFLADTWCAAFMIKKVDPIAPAITEDSFRRIQRNPHDVALPLKQEIQDLARQYRFFHWHLEFPEVFQPVKQGVKADNETMGWKGGFDVLLGNPPWEVSQLSDVEFFTSRSHGLAEMTGDNRKKAIARLESGNPTLWIEYQNTSRQFETENGFYRGCARFILTATGKINTYALFAELMLNLQSSTGRAGFIVPTGIATDDSTKKYFEAVSLGGRLVSLLDFENREKIFPAVDSRIKFALLTLGNRVRETRFTFFATRAEHLLEKERQFTLSPEDIRLINPNTRTCPVFRSQMDAELTKKIYRHVPVLIDDTQGDAGNPWAITFRQGLFNMTSDSHLFRTLEQLTAKGAVRDGVRWLDGEGAVWVPLYEAKMVHQFNHRWATYAENGVDSRDVELAEKMDPGYAPLPRYWVPEREIDSRLKAKGWNWGWLMGWRDICRSTDERTVIAGVIPRVGVGDPFLLMLPSVANISLMACLFGEQNSLVHDYVARQKIGGTHLKYNMKQQLTNLSPHAYKQSDVDLISTRVLELTYTAYDLKPFAEDLGYQGPPFPWDPDRRAHLRAELDAYYARLYGLTRDELRYILDPADVKGADYPSETFRGLKNKEMKEFGEYRTARLVLAAWDRLKQ